MTTTRQLINSSLRLAGVVQQNETAADEDFQVGKEALQNLIDVWSTNPQLVWLRDTVDFACTQSTYSVTLPYRPIRIMSATFEIGTQNAVIYGLTGLDEVSFYNTPIRHQGLPRQYFWNHDTTVELVGAATGTLKLVLQKSIDDPTFNLDAALNLPSGYLTAIKYNLAILLCDEFGKEPSQIMVATAADALSGIKSQNKRPAITRTDVANAFPNRGRLPIPRANQPQA